MLVANVDSYDKEVLDEVIANLDSYGFFDYCNADEWYMDAKGFSFYTGIRVEFGCTKAVFIHDDCEWVLKTNIKIVGYDKFKDYCRKEADYYEKAVESHLEKNFAPTYFYKEVGEYEFYIQKRVEIDEQMISSSCYDYMSRYVKEDEYDEEERYERICEYMYDMDDEERIYAIFGDKLGGMELDALIGFIQDLDINDLHSGNFGYRYVAGEPMPVLIDYSGY